jgi:hypothetical protein
MDSSEPSTPASTIFAHSLRDRPIEDWEPLSHHLTAVGNRAAEFAEAFGWKEAARVAGQLQDIGKCSAAFQAYIRRAREGDERTRGPDHSTAGAPSLQRLMARSAACSPSPLRVIIAAWPISAILNAGSSLSTQSSPIRNGKPMPAPRRRLLPCATQDHFRGVQIKGSSRLSWRGCCSPAWSTPT